MDLLLGRIGAKAVAWASVVCVLAPLSFGAAETAKRLRANIDDSRTYALKGNVRPAIASGSAQDLGAAPGSRPMPRMALQFSLTQAQQSDLAQLLVAQQNRRSPEYRKFLTPESFADRFGLNTADIAKVSTWLENGGFSNIQAARGRLSISFTGTVAQAQAAFHTSIHSWSIQGETHIANVSTPELPAALEGVVASVGGLDDFGPKTLGSVVAAAPVLAKPRISSANGTNYVAPSDWEAIYDVTPIYGSGVNGAPIGGQTYSIAVVGQSDVQAADLAAFRVAAGLPANAPTTVVASGDSDPGLQSGDQAISTLDLEWANAIAQNANIVFVVGNAGTGVNDAIQYAVNNNIAPVLTTSYGECEADLGSSALASQNNWYAQAAAQGMTVLAATGNNGAAACDTQSPATHGYAVVFPASSQYVTAIGGTEFNPVTGTNYGGYVPEVGWNDGNQSATGGGLSSIVTKPPWQTGTGVPSDGQRDLPDLAFTSSMQVDGLVVCLNGSCSNGGFVASGSAPAVSGGTGGAASAFAGVIALLVQQTGSRVGLIDPNLYSLAAISETVFHDVAGGNNNVTCAGNSPDCPATVAGSSGTFGYSAGVGFDLVTGWGSVDSFNLVSQWNEDIQLSANPASLSIAPGSSATSTVTVTPVKNFSGPVTFACSVGPAISANVTCSVPNTTVNTSGSVVVTINSAAVGQSFRPHRLFAPRPPGIPPAALGGIAAGLGFLGILFLIPTRKQLRLVYAAPPVLVLVSTVAAVSCGGGVSSASILSMSCNLPEPIVGQDYTGGYCSATGGKTPYAYSIVPVSSGGTGTLPPGLNLNASSGYITGTPTTALNYTFTLEVTDHANNTFQEALVLAVQPPQVHTGNVTVTATSGSITNSTNIAVTTSF